MYAKDEAAEDKDSHMQVRGNIEPEEGEPHFVCIPDAECGYKVNLNGHVGPGGSRHPLTSFHLFLKPFSKSKLSLISQSNFL